MLYATLVFSIRIHTIHRSQRASSHTSKFFLLPNVYRKLSSLSPLALSQSPLSPALQSQSWRQCWR